MRRWAYSRLAGGAREWAWKALAGGDLDLDAAAAAVAPGADGLLFLPYLMGERSPWWNPLARGAFVGLAMPHDKPQMARAVLEGVAFGLRQILDSLREHVPDIDARAPYRRRRQEPAVAADPGRHLWPADPHAGAEGRGDQLGRGRGGRRRRRAVRLVDCGRALAR